MEELGEEGEGREGRPHLFMLSISMGDPTASPSNSVTDLAEILL